MADVTRTDPLRNFKFRVNIMQPFVPGLSTLGFVSMSGLSVQNEIIQYREGGWNTAPHKMVGQSDFAPVSFNRGLLPQDPGLWQWQQVIFLYQWGNGLLSDPRAYRCDIQVEVFDHPVTKGVSLQNPGSPRVRYTLHNCWPGAFAVSDLNASDNGLIIQQMTIHHEGFDIDFPS